MNPFERYNPLHPDAVVFSSEDKPTVERVGEYLRLAGYHPRYNFVATYSREFAPGYVFHVFVPVDEMRAVREVLAKYEKDELEI
jgi:hypothetical protein